MSNGNANLQQGTIAWASVTDPRGVTKDRPIVIITETSEIVLDNPFVAVAISTRYPDPPPDECIELPWSRSRHPVTGLAKRSAAVCNWLVRMHTHDVLEIKGFVPLKTVAKIIANVRRLNA